MSDAQKRMKINHEETKGTKKIRKNLRDFFCSFFVFFVSSWLIL